MSDQIILKAKRTRRGKPATARLSASLTIQMTAAQRGALDLYATASNQLPAQVVRSALELYAQHNPAYQTILDAKKASAMETLMETVTDGDREILLHATTQSALAAAQEESTPEFV